MCYINYIAMETLTQDLVHSLPDICKMNIPACINLSWHVFDISTNHILNKINWNNGIINLLDDKLLICFGITYYNEINLITPINKIQDHAGGSINIRSIRDYFTEAGFMDLFANDPEITDMCNLKPTDFIIMPIYESRNHMYMALYNINPVYGQYLKSIYPDKQNKITTFYNLFELADGLQNHTNITGIQHATSFNLFRALFKTNIPSSKKTQAQYLYDSSKIAITPKLELPIMALYNSHSYFPQFQVVWTTNKIVMALPGVPAPTCKALLQKNKLLVRFQEKHNTTTDTPRIPRVMLKKYELNRDKLRLSWQTKYNKYCNSSYEPESHYTNLDKLINQMRSVKLTLTNLDT